MWQRRFDLPLGADGTTRFVPWLIAVMVYLAALALAAGMATADAASRWNAGLAGTATVEIAPASDRATTDERVGDALAILRATPGVIAATPISEAEVAELLAPWVTTGELPSELTLPRLIDVRFDPGTAVDLRTLGAKLSALIPGARLDDHGTWLQRLRALGTSVQIAAALVVALIAGASAATVIFATSAGLAIHREVIELMHWIGARDAYVARQFQSHAMSLALRGGVAGVLMGAATLAGFRALMGPSQGSLLPDVGLGPATWAALAILPLAAAGIATLTAKATVLRALRRLP